MQDSAEGRGAGRSKTADAVRSYDERYNKHYIMASYTASDVPAGTCSGIIMQQHSTCKAPKSCVDQAHQWPTRCIQLPSVEMTAHMFHPTASAAEGSSLAERVVCSPQHTHAHTKDVGHCRTPQSKAMYVKPSRPGGYRATTAALPTT